ncbi:hypothetical protein IB229_20905 [Pseudomonas sp. PDM14]|uniref:DUF6713 family protein n=1 Tax=Pseudomonas sp. PDM14 TaxID=2769288 RepID=UPI00178061E7|nr:DUF6713 family protein [Pseudomonas sp. PDM14]MBD9485446.1 hypothetical protein [Pseudomonas sp. PDM14]
MKNTLFTLCFSSFIGHELDAVSQAEWRLLYGLRDLPDAVAEPLFVALHVPLFALLIALAWAEHTKLRERTRLLLAGFSVFHAGLHHALRHHPLYTFDSPLSQALIFGCGLLGLAYLLAHWLGRRHTLNSITGSHQ